MAINLKVLAMDDRPRTRGRPKKNIINQPTTLQECAALLKQQGAAVAVLAVQDLQAYWLGIMSSKDASNKDKLTASKLYAESIGAFDKTADDGKRAPARYVWGNGANNEPVTEAEIINDSSDNDADKQTYIDNLT